MYSSRYNVASGLASAILEFWHPETFGVVGVAFVSMFDHENVRFSVGISFLAGLQATMLVLPVLAPVVLDLKYPVSFENVDSSCTEKR